MNLRDDLLAVVEGSDTGLTVDQAAAALISLRRAEIKRVLDELATEDRIERSPGTGPYKTMYHKRKLERRF